MQRTSIVTAALPLFGALLAANAFTQVRVGPQFRLDQDQGGAQANEVTLAASFAAPNVSIGGWNDYRAGNRTVFAVTRDGGLTWTESIVRPELAFQGFEGDPMTAFDGRTGTLWAGGIAFASNGGMYAARLEPGETVFEPTRMIDPNSGTDKGWMAAGPDPADLSRTRVYAAVTVA